MQELLAHRFVQHVHERVLEAGEFQHLLDRIAARDTDPYTVVDQVLTRSLARPAAAGPDALTGRAGAAGR